MKRVLIALMLCLVSIVGFAQSDNDSCYNWCSCISRKVDDFTNEVKISTPFYTKPSIDKYIYPNGTIKYYLYLSLDDSYCTAGGTGLIILFKDGTKFSRPNIKVDMDYYSGDKFTYSVFIPITQNEVKIFAQKEISKFKMYIFERNFKEIDIRAFKEYANCILELK